MTARQPFLHEELVVLRAPVQVWSRRDGAMIEGIHGLYCGDVRVARAMQWSVGGAQVEHIATSAAGSRATIRAVVRALDDATPDPGVTLTVERTVTGTSWTEHVTVHNRREVALTADLRLILSPDATPMDLVKQGGTAARAPAVHLRDGAAQWTSDGVLVTWSARGLSIGLDADAVIFRGALVVPAGGEVQASITAVVDDPSAVVRAASGSVPWRMPDSTDPRVRHWLEVAMADLDALRMETTAVPGSQFLAAGAPWFFTLFGRDSLWAARLMLPLGTDLARDTLRVLAAFQGTRTDVDSAEQPGKIMHELRRSALVVDDSVTLPPRYYGTVDATALWICLLHDAWRHGLADAEVRALLPPLRAALGWLRDHADPDGDGLIEYIDTSGHGLANQGWKDSGDSIRHRDGTFAAAPIALCEVQGYAYAAALGGAAVLGALGDAQDDPGYWRAWADRLRSRFHEVFWVADPEGDYPAIAIDGRGGRVDGVTSNIGHLLGTGILDDAQSAWVARRLAAPTMSSGLGLRTMSSDSAGYWPLSYHCGSVWAHDTAIAIAGLAASGHTAQARDLATGLLRAAEGFDYRIPELHAGFGGPDPVPYPAACRPQAWSAAAAVTVAHVLG